jgi:peptidoglycan/LPS O-acetylase OafA/YrhL
MTVHAVGTALTDLPLSAATAARRHKRLLLTAMAAFAVANTVTALSGNCPLTMPARFVAGVAAGLAWALLGGCARRPGSGRRPRSSRCGTRPWPAAESSEGCCSRAHGFPVRPTGS